MQSLIRLPFLGKRGGENMQQFTGNINTATFIGIDAHPTEHTALAMNRFEDQKGILQFENTKEGINQFLSWLPTIDKDQQNVIIGVEGGGNTRHALMAHLLCAYQNIYEVNPLYTKQRRTFGTRRDKSDPRDAKAIAEVMTKKLDELPRITAHDLSTTILSLKKIVWFYEEETVHGTAIQNQLHQLKREYLLSMTPEEKAVLHLIIKQKEHEFRQIKKRKKMCEKQLLPLLAHQGKNLLSMKGISTILAAKIVAHSGGIERFHNYNGFIRYAGIAPQEKSSGKTKRHMRTKTGNRNLNTTLYLAALIQIRWNPKAKEYFEKKLKEGKTKKHALKCLMKRTACIIYGMLKSGENYRG